MKYGSIFASLLFVILIPAFAFANWNIDFIQSQEIGAFKTGIGSKIKFSQGQALAHDGIFLGQLINHDGSVNSLMVLDQELSQVQYLPANSISQIPLGLQNVLRLYEQQGGTCTGYAIDDFLLQTHLSGFQGNGRLSEEVSTEEGRTALLADAINQYYLVLQHRFSILGILNQYGKKYDFSCKKHLFDDPTAAKQFILESVSSGLPVLLSFEVGTQMYKGPFDLIQMKPGKNPEDNRLWLPRKKGERDGGGHSVVAAASFSNGKNDYLVMLDSDWNLPRVWDLNKAISDRSAMGDYEFFTCQ